MKFTAYPLKGVNDIEFGMTAQMVGARMHGRLEIGDFRATSTDHPTYYYPDEPVFFYFDEHGHLEGIEFCEGADVLLGGLNFLELPVRVAFAALAKLDPQTVVDHEGAQSPQLSIALWCPNLTDPEDPEPVESILFARPGYYDASQ